jgi:hypothetical protein
VIPERRVEATYPTARRILPSRVSSTESVAKVETVVQAPRNPTHANGRAIVLEANRSSIKVKTTPIANAPEVLTTKVVVGNPPGCAGNAIPTS